MSPHFTQIVTLVANSGLVAENGSTFLLFRDTVATIEAQTSEVAHRRASIGTSALSSKDLGRPVEDSITRECGQLTAVSQSAPRCSQEAH